jgi:hypothetical protein
MHVWLAVEGEAANLTCSGLIQVSANFGHLTSLTQGNTHEE